MTTDFSSTMKEKSIEEWESMLIPGRLMEQSLSSSLGIQTSHCPKHDFPESPYGYKYGTCLLSTNNLLLQGELHHQRVKYCRLIGKTGGLETSVF
ncbi:putative guanine nucleotide bionding protein beta subunit [Corchorus olitorius]|uniref:Guanine nucleotide bionding protein beta subunit n=1 Tax=Corchorus olitorius TaxID=93759 RepID=A0A1R3HBU2_9ROSI|nr:putative guanine nucleotide bionding protein beta subunit [Corchorus olitorius]